MGNKICRAEQLRRKFHNHELVVGGHVFYADSEITEQLGNHGFEFVWIDAEHSALDLKCVLSHIMAAAAADTASIVRVAWNDPVRIKPVLEMGPDGIILPMVCTKEEAESAVRSCTYPPRGIRGFGPRRANQYGAMDTITYLENADRSFLRILQIEHRDAVENLDEILTVEGIDLLVVGPNDLSASYGLLGHTRDPRMMPIYDEIARKCRAAGIPFGVSVGAGDRESMKEWIRRGVSFLGCGDDISYISMGCRQTLAYLNTIVKE